MSAGSTVQATLVDSSDQSIEVPTTSFEDTEGTGAFEPFLTHSFPETDLLSQINISGSPALRKRIMDLCTEFRVLFKNFLPPAPARLLPFELIVDEAKWQISANRNILHLKEDPNPVIVRWAVALSELDCTLGFIAGTNNIIADFMSRLCDNNMLETPSVVAPLTNISASVIASYHCIPSQQHGWSYGSSIDSETSDCF